MPVSKKLLALHPISPGTVELTSGFWGDRQIQNREVTIPYGMEMMEGSGTLENFRVAAAGGSSAQYHLPLFRDSDLYKVLEAIAWERAHGPDPEQEKFFRSSAELLAQAQEPDGYLNTYVRVVQQGRRFQDAAMGHELYCAGHLFQAAVADARTAAPGPVQLGPVVDRYASMLVDVLGSEQAGFVEGHPEIETALVELYRTTRDPRLVELAGDLLARRGHKVLSWRSFGPSYFQDDVPFAEAGSIRGHAVRALYLLAGATDIYTETGRAHLRGPIFSQWDDMVSAKTYLTGGVGSRHRDEAFGDRFELPPDRAYCERCAAIASIMWNWRLLLLTGEARFADLIERTLYNGFLAGIGFDGTSFFYENPLQVRVPTARHAWYDCACCPPNGMRLLASLEHYFVTTTDQGAQFHQYASCRVQTNPGSEGSLDLAVETDYPNGGTVVFRVDAAPAISREIALRVPSWATHATATLNGRSVGGEPGADGYLRLRREWSGGDELMVEFPLRPRVVRASDDIDGARGCVAFERGPLVYCVEGHDLASEHPLQDISVRASVPKEEPALDIGGQQVVALKLQARARSTGAPPWPYFAAGSEAEAKGDVGASNRGVEPGDGDLEVRAIPYFAWANRGATDMRVWVPERH
jgi:uncharacterized protein